MAVVHRRMRTVGVVACVMWCGLAATARADLPPAMDRAPAEALGIVAMRDIGQFHKRLTEYMGLFDLEADTPPLSVIGELVATPGLARGGSAMVVILPPSAGENDPRPVLVAPVSDTAMFAKSLNAQGQGIMTATLDGDEVFMKDAGGGYVVMSPDRATVESFTLGMGSAAAMKQSMGATAARASDKADLVIYLTPGLVNQGLASVGEGMVEQVGMMSMMLGPGAGPGAAMSRASEMMSERFEADGQSMVITMSADDVGMVIDFVSQFKEGSPSARMFQIDGSARSLASALPDGKMLLAGSVDTSSPMLKSWMRDMRADEAGALAMLAPMFDSMEKIDGMAMSIGVPPAGLMGGMLTAGTTFIKTADPKGLTNAVKTAMEGMNGRAAGGGKIAASYKPGAVDAGGAKVDSWQFTVPMDNMDPNAMGAQQMQMMLFGMAPGPSGLIGATDKGVVMTIGSNSQLMGSAMQAAAGGKGMTGQDAFASVHSRLQDDRVFEVYVGVKGIIDMVGPFMAMQTGGAPIRTPEKLAPVAFAGTMSGGAMGIRLVMPRDVLSLLGDVTAEMRGAMDDMDDMDDDMDDEDDAGPPRF